MFKLRTSVQWVPEQKGAFMVIPGQGSLRLPETDAIIWDLINRFPDPEDISRLLQAIFMLNEKEADLMLKENIIKFQKLGLLK